MHPPGRARVKFLRTYFAGCGRFGGWEWLKKDVNFFKEKSACTISTLQKLYILRYVMAIQTSNMWVVRCAVTAYWGRTFIQITYYHWLFSLYSMLSRWLHTRLSVLFHDVANVIELSECCCQLVKVVTESVWCQIHDTPINDFWKPENQLGKFPLLWIVQLYGCRVSCQLYLCCTHACCSCDGSETGNSVINITLVM